MGINRNTISRWELGYYGPDKAADVIALADATGTDRQEALAAAGILPVGESPERPRHPEPPMDPDVRRLLRALADPDTPPGEKQFIRDFLRLAAQRLDALEAEQRRRRDVS